jgi:hypothetical protein
MALYALIDPNSRVCQLSAAIFPVATPMRWTSDVSAITPSPQYGWAATETGGTWAFTAPAEPVRTLAQQAAAIERRHALDSLAAAGEAVPADVTHKAEASVRAAELELVRARAEVVPK